MTEVKGCELDIVRISRSAELALPCGRVPLLGDADLHVWVLSLDQWSQLEHRFRNLLSSKEQHRASRYATADLCRRYIVAHAQVRLILASYVDASPASLVFREGPAGKPFLEHAAGRQTTFFNLTHSGAWGLLAVARAEVGVDIEQIRDFEGLEKIAYHNFASGEYAAFTRVPPADRLEAFFACWTRKEAFIKADGRGLSLPLGSFEVTVDPHAPAALLSCGGCRESTRAIALSDLRVVPNYRAAVVTRRGLPLRVLQLL